MACSCPGTQSSRFFAFVARVIWVKQPFCQVDIIKMSIYFLTSHLLVQSLLDLLLAVLLHLDDIWSFRMKFGEKGYMVPI